MLVLKDGDFLHLSYLVTSEIDVILSALLSSVQRCSLRVLAVKNVHKTLNLSGIAKKGIQWIATQTVRFTLREKHFVGFSERIFHQTRYRKAALQSSGEICASKIAVKYVERSFSDACVWYS
jgi:hypothetical protein